MAPASPAAVLGRFDSASVSLAGAPSIFFRRGNDYVVNTEGDDGRPHDFVIKYTFGVAPLQQYLVELSHGRLQPIAAAWDARPARDGGQRWFAIDPGPRAAHTDEFHWTSRQRNWNYMCADCHSTGVAKNFVAAADSFRTTWAELNVSCEACHGPASRHLSWARYPGWLRRAAWNDDGLSSKLTERAGVRWSIDSVTGNARRNVPRSSNREVQTCAACHSRRVQVADRAASGHTLLDRYLPSLILPGLYYADGQQRDEVYDYGSFLQSRMYHAGVTCSDCHNPHTGSVRSSGNALCAQCHRPEKYDTIAHTFHARGSPGSSCISCHMPSRIYMQVDARQDHSIRIPRPDQSQRYGTPNACNLCHTNRDAAWASGQVLRWYGHQASGYQRFADAFAADERQDTSAGRALTSLATDRTQPSIVRASALARLALRPASIPPATLQRLAMDSSALVRYGALLTLESFPPASRVAAAAPLLADSVRAVRIQAAWVLAPVAGELTGDAAAHFTTAASDFIESQRYNGDRAENRLTLGTFLAELGRFDEATAAFSGAIALSPDLAEAYANLADVERGQGQEKKSESTLRLGITKSPADPRLHYALGLALARQQRLADAVASLATADSLAPNDASIGYGYALALHSAGEDRKARSVAMRVLASAPGDSRVRELLRELK